MPFLLGIFLDKRHCTGKRRQAPDEKTEKGSEGMIFPVKRDCYCLMLSSNDQVPNYEIRSIAASAVDERSSDNSAKGNARQLHCIETEVWNKFRKADYLTAFP